MPPFFDTVEEKLYIYVVSYCPVNPEGFGAYSVVKPRR